MSDLVKSQSDLVQVDTPKPGIYYDVPFDDYIKIPAMSKSALFPANTSPLNFVHVASERAKEDPAEAAAHFALGHAIHTAILEPHLFDDTTIVAPKINKRTNAGKAQWAALQAEASERGVTILTNEQYEQCMGMSESVAGHERAQDILAGGKSEVTVINYDEEFDMYRKCRLDWFVDNSIIVDLKSVGRSADENFVIKQIFDLGYYLQASMYLDATGKELGQLLNHFIFMFVESTPPYHVGLYAVGQEMRKLGDRKYEQLMTTIKECSESGVWPHYNDNAIVEIDFKPWMVYEITKNMG